MKTKQGRRVTKKECIVTDEKYFNTDDPDKILVITTYRKK